MTVSAPVTTASPRKRRKWLRRMAVLGLLLLAVAGVGAWQVFYEPPLTEEEQRFVGFWKPSGGYEYLWVDEPVQTVAFEYRADGTIRCHRIDTKTKVRSVVENGLTWRVSHGQMVNNYLGSHTLKRHLSGDFTRTQKLSWQITWDGPNQFRADRIDQPPGVRWPTFVYTRCPDPGGPQP